MPLLIEEAGDGGPPHEQAFNFHHLPDARYGTCGDSTVQPLLDKWGFGQDMTMVTFRVEQPVGPDSMQAMLDAFFRDRHVVGVLHALTRLRVLRPEKCTARWQKMLTDVVSMSFFNKFEECDAIGKSGHIRGRIEEDWEGVPILNIIREVLLMEDSDLYDTFSERERKQFLLKIFQHVVFGGASNQYEDHVEEYFRATKLIYKDLLSVRRNDVGDVEVMSTVAQIHSLSDGGVLFPKESLLNFCYVIYDPLTRHVKLWYFGYRPVW